MKMAPWFSALPAYPVSEIYEAFGARDRTAPLLLEAEPGAGKSTLVPLWLLHELLADNRAGTIYLVQPRILAAQALAARLAALTHTTLGELVGYQVPHRQKLGDATRLIVTTPGLLVQKLLRDPEGQGIACVILDEIHERSVNQDLLFAILQEVQVLNDALELLLMTATPDAKLRAAVPQSLFAPGFCHPVTVRYLPPQGASHHFSFEREQLPSLVAEALASHADVDQHTVLVFLPGWGAIESVAGHLQARMPQLALHRLHSRVDAREQARALDEASGPRIILSTNIAETSLTIKDVTLVIDAGLMRRQQFEQKTAVARLRTGRISQASAEQRAGRAGRVQAGTCIRLWSKDERLAGADLPELRACDYLPLALKIAHWGAPSDSLPWLEKPNPLALEQAFRALTQWQLVAPSDTGGWAITERGRRASELGTHPRIAALLLEIAESQESLNRAALLLTCAALHADLHVTPNLDDWLAQAAHELAQNAVWQQQLERWQRQLRLPQAFVKGWRLAPDAYAFGPLEHACLARALVDRLGVLQVSGRYGLANGASFGSALDKTTKPCQSEFALALALGIFRDELIGVTVPLNIDAQLRQTLTTRVREPQFKNARWSWREREYLGPQVLSERSLPSDAALLPAVVRVLISEVQSALARQSLAELMSHEAAALLGKARLLMGKNLLAPLALDDASLSDTLEQWLGPFIDETSTLARMPWRAGLEFYLGYERLNTVQQLVPDAITLPSGRRVAVEFNEAGEVCVAAKLQEFFGCESLEFAEGRLPVKISLLSPNGSPLAVTSNLKTFWQNAYPEVRKTTRGRYPRHPWPEDPLAHAATALTNRKLQQQKSE